MAARGPHALTQEAQRVHAVLSVLLHFVKEALRSPRVCPENNGHRLSKLIQLEKTHTTLVNDGTVRRALVHR